MRKRGMSVLSLMIAFIIMLVPVASLRARAEEGQEYTYTAEKSTYDFTTGINGNLQVTVDAPEGSVTDVLIDGVDTEGLWSSRMMFRLYHVFLNVELIESLPIGANRVTIVFEGDHSTTITVNVIQNPYTYECISGNGGSHVKGSGESLTFVFNGTEENCPTAGIDQSMDAHDYIVSSDDPVNNLATVILPAEFLDTLDVGEHLLQVFFYGRPGWRDAKFTIEPPVYTYSILEGDNQKYDPKAGGDIVVRIDGPDDQVNDVLVDDGVIGSENYTISFGSTVLTLTDDYLKTLSAGEHTVQVNYEGGKTSEEATFTIAEVTPEESNESSESSESSENTESSDKYTYTILEGDNQEYDPKAGGDIVVRIDGPNDQVSEVLVDDGVIGSENYTISFSSAVLTMTDDYLKTLSAGKHTVQVNYEGGKTSERATFTIAEVTPEESNESSESSESSENTESSENSGNSESSGISESSTPAESSGTGESSSTGESSTESSAAGSESSEKADSSSSGSSEKTTSESSDQPKTGDNGLAVAASLLMISLIGVAGVLVAKRKLTAE